MTQTKKWSMNRIATMKLKQDEVDLLQSLADGKAVKEYARENGRDVGAVRTEKHRVSMKLGSDNIVKAIVRAFSLGLIK